MSSANSSRKTGTNHVQKLSVATEQKINQAAELIRNSDALLFTSGAGMSANSGLGTFRGSAAAVWPPLLQHPELGYTDIVTPDWFNKPQGNSSKHDTVNFAYAFWADRYNEYASAIPHRGYSIAKQWSELNNVKFAFSFTSNIDGHWIKSGWSESSLFECHGSIHYMQCVYNCCDRAWSTNDELKLEVDSKTNCVINRLPVCPDCHELARPNVLMFNDWHFAGQRYNEKIGLYGQFKADVATAKAKLLIIELGAGTTVPSVRNESECLFTDKRWTADLVRINPLAEHSTINKSIQDKSKGQALEITLDALTALVLIDKAIKNKSKQ
jgi:NAD-dependent SIR2 family protein deacetylase